MRIRNEVHVAVEILLAERDKIDIAIQTLPLISPGKSAITAPKKHKAGRTWTPARWKKFQETMC